jgi:uncharacterized integral membrane protein
VSDENRPFDAVPPVKPRRVGPGSIVGASIVVLALIFSFQNTETSIVEFLWMDLDAPIWVWFLMLFVLGIATGWLAHILWARRRTGES